MKHPKRPAKARLLAAAVAAAAAVVAAGPADAAAPVACAGTVNLTGTSNFEVRAAGLETFVSFDFTGTHDLCLADGSLVIGTVQGHLLQRLAPDGDLTLRFDEVLSYGGGTLGYRGEASLSGPNWQSHVQTVGAGTGVLAGISGQGSFFPTGPTSFADVIDYVYR
jgi:opacity protein-like surface antigen